MIDLIKNLSEIILTKFYAHTHDHVFTVAISGIDASGKGYVAKCLESELVCKGWNVANINIDPWQNPIPIRLNKENPAENFYEAAFRWDDMFEKLIVPLKKDKSIQLTSRLIFSHADEYFDHQFSYRNIDILLLDGIFLFQEQFLECYDFKIWIDCSFQTGLKRAIGRNIEKLSKERLVQDYETYYYPAQRYHFEKDNPKTLSDIIYCNDQLIGSVGQVTINAHGVT